MRCAVLSDPVHGHAWAARMRTRGPVVCSNAPGKPSQSCSAAYSTIAAVLRRGSALRSFGSLTRSVGLTAGYRLAAWEAFDVLATDTFNQFLDLDANIMHLINVDLSPLQVTSAPVAPMLARARSRLRHAGPSRQACRGGLANSAAGAHLFAQGAQPAVEGAAQVQEAAAVRSGGHSKRQRTWPTVEPSGDCRRGVFDAVQ